MLVLSWPCINIIVEDWSIVSVHGGRKVPEERTFQDTTTFPVVSFYIATRIMATS